MGDDCWLVARDGYRHGTAGPIRLSPEAPRGEAVIRLPAPRDLEVRVVDEDGAPIADAEVSLDLGPPPEGLGRLGLGKTDAQGRLDVRDLPGDARVHEVFAEFNKDFVALSAPVAPDAKSVVLRASRGRVWEGTLVEMGAETPIPGVLVTAEPWLKSRVMSEGPTDEQGRFRFSNLPEGAFRVFCGARPFGVAAPLFTTESRQPTTLRVAPNQSSLWNRDGFVRSQAGAVARPEGPPFPAD